MADHSLIGDNAPDTSAPDVVEAKVWAATGATLLLTAVLAVLNAVATDSSLLGPLPGWLQAILIPLIPSLITLASGYLKKSNRV